MKLLIDTNVILDVLLARGPFCDTAERVLGLSQREDVEDAVQYSVALLSDFDAIITRDMTGYYNSKVRVVSPKQILSELA